MIIIGAGLSGLLAGALIPGSHIYERQESLPHNHGAILRFRGDKISKALNIPFKKVRVTKAIWLDGQEVPPTPRIQNLYSNKVTYKYGQRSIADIEPVDRYIAPGDFIEQLAERCNIQYGVDYNGAIESDCGVHCPGSCSVISTMPLPVLIDVLELGHKGIELERYPIWTRTFEFLPDVDLYQTIYFPGPETNLYRASFTGNKLICEYIANPDHVGGCLPLNSFGLQPVIFYEPEKVTEKQEYGKIIPIDESIRRSIVQQISQNHNIYSLGRYATWRNILLDDVFDDIHKIKELMRMDDYTRRLNQ